MQLKLRHIFWLGALTGCISQDTPQERVYTVEADLRATSATQSISAEQFSKERGKITKAPLKKINKLLVSKQLLVGDIEDGKNRLAELESCLAQEAVENCQEAITTIEEEIRGIAINAEFIDKKNSRLLGLIQEVKPSAEMQAQIDKESEIINELLEHADYQAINQHMNLLFQWLEAE